MAEPIELNREITTQGKNALIASANELDASSKDFGLKSINLFNAWTGTGSQGFKNACDDVELFISRSSYLLETQANNLGLAADMIFRGDSDSSNAIAKIS